MFTTKDRQILFYHNKTHIFFYQAPDPISTVKVCKLCIHANSSPSYCLVIVSQKQYICIFYDIVLHEYRKHETLRSEICRLLQPCKSLLSGVSLEEAVQNVIRNCSSDSISLSSLNNFQESPPSM
eukprot:TRINITY_DN21486_c0_g1_i2.p3 TRINITY_DN21486_c0_g1~~TRINITY_DN21486_c0_g1_i2.p3  ORF type:complete len:125 (+),score=7.75 TRINITY_DN21486_c0_g1_i2:299-673(+)